MRYDPEKPSKFLENHNKAMQDYLNELALSETVQIIPETEPEISTPQFYSNVGMDRDRLVKRTIPMIRQVGGLLTRS